MTFEEFLFNIENLVNIKKVENDEYNILFVDFEYTNNGPNSPNVFEIKGKLVNSIGVTEDYNSVYDFLISNLLDLGLQSLDKLDNINNERFTKKIVEEDSVIYERRLLNRMNFVSNHIAINGYIGPANFIISNTKNSKYLETYCKYSTYVNNVIHDGILKDDEIIMGRINSIDQPGVVFIYQIDDDKINYKIVNTGIVPTKQFMCFKY